MINLSPSDKKLLALLILVFTIIFSVIVVDFVLNFNMIFKSVDNVERASSDLEEKLKSIMETPKDTRPAMIRKALNNFFDLMNNGDYEGAYSLLTDDFKKNQFNNNFDSFCEFMKSYGNKTYSPYFEKYSRFGSSYMVLVSFVPYSNTDEDIMNTSKPEKTDTFVINFTDEDNYTLSFLRYVGEKELGTGVENSMFRVILDKTVLYKTKSEYYFTITNNTDTAINIEPKHISCYTGLKPRFYTSPISVPPHFSTSFCFSVGTGLSIADAVPNEIYFKNINVGGNDYSFEIDTEFCLDF